MNQKESTNKRKRTALVLGGGGSRGAYETGVWQALRELGIKIDAAYGTSVGSITAAAVAQDNFDGAVELWNNIEASMIFDINIEKFEDDSKLARLAKFKPDIKGLPLEEARAYLKEMLEHGGATTEGLRSILNRYLDEEAIRNSDIDFGLATIELGPASLVPRYMYISDIDKDLLIDYIIASCTVAPAIRPHEINGKHYIDGGYFDVVPVRLALSKGFENIIAVNLHATGLFRAEDYREAEETAESFVSISFNGDKNNTMTFNRETSRRLMRLGYLDTMKAYGIFEGNVYTFPKQEFGKKSLTAADCAAKIFSLDPEVIYTQSSLNDSLTDKISEIVSVKEELRKELSGMKLAAARSFAKDIISKKNGRELITLIIADELKKGNDAAVSSRTARKLIGDEIQAAKYLLSYNLI